MYALYRSQSIRSYQDVVLEGRTGSSISSARSTGPTESRTSRAKTSGWRCRRRSSSCARARNQNIRARTTPEQEPAPTGGLPTDDPAENEQPTPEGVETNPRARQPLMRIAVLFDGASRRNGAAHRRSRPNSWRTVIHAHDAHHLSNPIHRALATQPPVVETTTTLEYSITLAS